MAANDEYRENNEINKNKRKTRNQNYLRILHIL